MKAILKQMQNETSNAGKVCVNWCFLPGSSQEQDDFCLAKSRSTASGCLSASGVTNSNVSGVLSWLMSKMQMFKCIDVSFKYGPAMTSVHATRIAQRGTFMYVLIPVGDDVCPDKL